MNNGRRSKLGSSARARLLKREAHGMQKRLSEEKLLCAETHDLERLARWLGVLPERTRALVARESDWRRAVVLAVLREERRLSTCLKSERWNLRGERVTDSD